MISFLTTSGRPSCSIVSRLLGICRSTIAMLPRCLKIETRNRARSPKAKPKSRAPRLLQFLLAAVGRDALHQRHGVVRLQHLGLELPHAAVQAKHRRLADGDVQIAGALLDHGVQQFVDQNRSHADTLPHACKSLECVAWAMRRRTINARAHRQCGAIAPRQAICAAQRSAPWRQAHQRCARASGLHVARDRRLRGARASHSGRAPAGRVTAIIRRSREIRSMSRPNGAGQRYFANECRQNRPSHASRRRANSPPPCAAAADSAPVNSVAITTPIATQRPALITLGHAEDFFEGRDPHAALCGCRRRKALSSLA